MRTGDTTGRVERKDGGSIDCVARRAGWWLVTVAYAACMFCLSSFPGTLTPEPFLHFDKVAHFLVFALLAILLRRALESSQASFAILNPYLLAVLLAACYAASDEIHQAFVPGRTASVSDWVADVLGAAFAQGFIYIRTRRHMGAGSPAR